MADKIITITQPPSIDSTRLNVVRVNGVTRMVFVYDPPGSPGHTQIAEVLDNELTGTQQTNLNSSLLAAYNLAKTKMGF